MFVPTTVFLFRLLSRATGLSKKKGTEVKAKNEVEMLMILYLYVFGFLFPYYSSLCSQLILKIAQQPNQHI